MASCSRGFGNKGIDLATWDDVPQFVEDLVTSDLTESLMSNEVCCLKKRF
jgi:hypothetical protein